MKLRILSALALAFALVLGMAPGQTKAAAYGTNFSVSITYQNVGGGPANVTVNFYPENSSTATPFTPAGGPLAAKAGTSLNVGSVFTTGSFKGSAVISADQPLASVIVEFDPAGVVRHRPLSNGFTVTDASSKQLVATVLKNTGNSNTVFAVQNADAVANDVTVQFFAVGAATPTHTAVAFGLPAGASKYFDAAQIAELGTTFSGSAVVTSLQSGSTSSLGKVVVTVNELNYNNNAARAFEGVASGGSIIYMPSAICNFGATSQNSFYAIQAVDGDVTYNVVFRNSAGAETTVSKPNLTAGSKASVAGCEGLSAGSLGSARIVKTAGTGQLVAVGKVAGSNGTISTAFLGFTSGSRQIAAPYVRWAPDSTFNDGRRQRTSLAIQNISGSDATNVRVQYVDRNGVVLGTHTIGTIASNAKASSDPNLAGALDSCGRFGEYGSGVGGNPCLGDQFGGGAIVLSDGGELVVVSRVFSGLFTQFPDKVWGEDYSGIDY